MNSTNGYLFNSMGRIGIDFTDQTAENLYNTRFGNYMISNYFSDSTSDKHIKFATQQPDIMSNASMGVAGGVIDQYSFLLTNTDSERPLEKLQLIQDQNTVYFRKILLNQFLKLQSWKILLK